MDDPLIVAVEWGIFEGQRPRHAGCNARLGEHGRTVRVPIARLTLADGSRGFGRCTANQRQAESILGLRLSHLFTLEEGAAEIGLPFDFPLWDLAGQRAEQPVYALAAAINGGTVDGPPRVPCYDTSLYFDDLHLADDAAAGELIVAEAQEGYARNHRAFKLKVGRGARHMTLEAGTARDIAIIRAVRAAVGPECVLMIDANNGYNLNLTKRVLAETANCQLFWLEEAFHEDNVLYDDLRAWLAAQGLATLIADGEGHAAPRLLDWAQAGTIHVIQYDIFSYGFTPWLRLGRRLDGWGVRTAPHHYGGFYGNYAAGHLATAINGFTFVEWDEAAIPGIDTGHYTISDGAVNLPNRPGFGLTLDEAHFQHAVRTSGYRVQC
jgi:L-alanine-DL-glutamate epimerase-like enolase superfamily enzyme